MPHMPVEERAARAPYIVQAGKVAFAGGATTGTAVIPEFVAATDVVFLSNNPTTSENNSLSYVMSGTTMTVSRIGTVTSVAVIPYMVIRYPA